MGVSPGESLHILQYLRETTTTITTTPTSTGTPIPKPTLNAKSSFPDVEVGGATVVVRFVVDDVEGITVAFAGELDGATVVVRCVVDNVEGIIVANVGELAVDGRTALPFVTTFLLKFAKSCGFDFERCTKHW